MKTVHKVVCKVVKEGKRNKPRNIWKITEHPDKELIGLSTYFSVPPAKNYPIGSTYTETIEVPE